jgi:ferric-dicitrate binding protein FerR (iron transport regulator)
MTTHDHDEDRRTPLHEEDQLAELIRLADGATSVPQDRAARVKGAVRSHWRTRVQRRRRTRVVWTGAGLAAAAVLVVAVGLMLWSGIAEAPVQGHPVGQVVAVSGPAWARTQDADTRASAAPVQVGQSVAVGLDLATGESRVALLMDGGTSVRLDRNTRLRLLSDASLALDAGTVYVDSGPADHAGRAIEIHTDAGRIRDIGTQFEVRVQEGAVRVRVREGKVVVDTPSDSHEVGMGGQIEMDPSGGVLRGEIATYGNDWDWIGAIAPMLSLEGRSARAFLDWASRERGWELRFTDEDVERSASSIVLSGSADGLTIEQALDAVLPTCRMAHQVENGVLLVRFLPEQGG